MIASRHPDAPGNDRVRRARRIVPRRAAVPTGPATTLPQDLEWCDRPPPGLHRPLHRRGRCGRGGALRARPRPGDRRTGRGHNVAGTAVCDDGIVIDLSRCGPCGSTPPVARPGCRLVLCGATSTTRRRPMVWPPPVASWATPASPGSPSAAASASSCANTGSPSTTCLPPRWSPPRAASSGRPLTNTPICSGRCEAAAANFGVVTSFRFALHPVGPTVMAGPVFWAAEDTTDVLRFYRDFAAKPRRARHRRQARHRPPTAGHPRGPALAAGHRRRLLLRRRRRRRRACVRALRRFGAPLRRPARTLAVRRFPGRPRRHRPARVALLLEGDEPRRSLRRRHRRHRRSRLRRQLAPVVRGDVPSGGAVARVLHDATAYAGRDVAHTISIDAVRLPDESGEHAATETAWARRFLQASNRTARGVYVDFLDSDD